jgi:AcrR family transcriptional regulator
MVSPARCWSTHGEAPYFALEAFGCVPLLRRHGLAKTTVVDVARALGMSHANVYRHFTSKAALRAAVAERWLKAISDPLDAFVHEKGPSASRLAAASLDATLRFHPHHVQAGRASEKELRAVVKLVLAGLRSGVL